MVDKDNDFQMPEEVDFSNSVPNPYAGRTCRRITINIDGDTIDYFKAEAERTGIPYQRIINLFLGQCAREKKHLKFA